MGLAHRFQVGGVRPVWPRYQCQSRVSLCVCGWTLTVSIIPASARTWYAPRENPANTNENACIGRVWSAYQIGRYGLLDCCPQCNDWTAKYTRVRLFSRYFYIRTI